MSPRRHPGSGFTLIEVLIALALVATTLTGAMALIRTTIGNQDHLERRVYATWVAENVAARYRLEPGDFGPRERSGVEVMMGRRFAWTLELGEVPDGETGESLLALRPVTVSVHAEQDAATRLAVRTFNVLAGSDS